MTEDEVLKEAAEAIMAADEDRAVAAAHEAVRLGLPALRVIDEGLGAGMKVVGDRFERGQVFLPEVIIASEAMMAAVAILEQSLPVEGRGQKAGVAVLGSIEGDIHDIGKGIVATMLKVYGFEVHDLGRDVPVATFVEQVRVHEADIVGSSALMTTTMVGQKLLERALAEAGLREKVRTMVGGAVVTQHWADRIGADGYAEDAQEAVAKALQLVGAA